MQFLKFTPSMLTLAVCTLTTQPQKELEIAVTYLPNDCPATAKTGDAIKVNYVSLGLDWGQPLSITFSVGQVIKGLDEGLKGMCLNEKRALTIPSDMAYVWDVELATLAELNVKAGGRMDFNISLEGIANV
ncbi:hypothetical protein DFH29DRAFT_1076579 [Suillus ampliporus]|nr:hypothetical protein DFH29DRAFT_1076579 [Suillus ampliporus]